MTADNIGYLVIGFCAGLFLIDWLAGRAYRIRGELVDAQRERLQTQSEYIAALEGHLNR